MVTALTGRPCDIRAATSAAQEARRGGRGHNRPGRMPIGIIRGDRLFDQPQRLIGGTPGMQVGLAESTPPGFIEKPDRPAHPAFDLTQSGGRACFFSAGTPDRDS